MNARRGMKKVKEQHNLICFSTGLRKYRKKYLGRSTGSFRNNCLTLKFLIFMSGMPLVEHLSFPTPAFHATSVPLPLSEPIHLASCYPAQWARGTLNTASTFAFHRCYLGRLHSHCLLFPPPSPSTTCANAACIWFWFRPCAALLLSPIFCPLKVYFLCNFHSYFAFGFFN